MTVALFVSVHPRKFWQRVTRCQAELRYLQSMPVERIVKYFEDHGFSLDKNTAHGFLRKTAELLKPLYEACGTAVKEDGYAICDETYHKVLVLSEYLLEGKV